MQNSGGRESEHFWICRALQSPFRSSGFRFWINSLIWENTNRQDPEIPSWESNFKGKLDCIPRNRHQKAQWNLQKKASKISQNFKFFFSINFNATFTECLNVPLPNSLDQAPVPLTTFLLNSKFDQNLQSSSLKYTLLITTKFCTRHDSYTVMMCAKFYCDQLNIF